jgi:hypothetical protein
LLVWLNWVDQHKPAQLGVAAQRFDAVSIIDQNGTLLTLQNYDHQLSVIATALPAPAMIAEVVGGGGAAVSPPLSPAIQKLTRRKRIMDWLQHTATLFSVFTLAYMTTFNNNPSFGTLVDYLQTVLYGLGLSTAGSQILTKARSTFAKT